MKKRRNSIRQTGKNSFQLTFSEKTGKRLGRRLSEGGEKLSVELALDEVVYGDERDRKESP